VPNVLCRWRLQSRVRCVERGGHSTLIVMCTQEFRTEIHGGFDEMKQLASQVCCLFSFAVFLSLTMTLDGYTGYAQRFCDNI